MKKGIAISVTKVSDRYLFSRGLEGVYPIQHI